MPLLITHPSPYMLDFRPPQIKWEEYAKLRPRSDVLRPLSVLSAVELVVVRKGKGHLAEEGGDEWTANEEDELELIEVSRPAGMNDVGMVAWKVRSSDGRGGRGL